MKISVHSRQAVEALGPLVVPHIFISVKVPNDSSVVKLPTSSSTLGTLHLEFHDLGDEAMVYVDVRDQYEAQCFSREHARRILAFINEHNHAQALIVHCDAGLSRSPGIAAALSKILSGDDSYFFKRYTPNSRVYRLILEEHYAPESEQNNGDNHH